MAVTKRFPKAYQHGIETLRNLLPRLISYHHVIKYVSWFYFHLHKYHLATCYSTKIVHIQDLFWNAFLMPCCTFCFLCSQTESLAVENCSSCLSQQWSFLHLLVQSWSRKEWSWQFLKALTNCKIFPECMGLLV